DFGIAKAVSQVEHTKPGVVKGKFAYMSPEQTTGDPLDGRSDVFSLGLVLWELLAGRVALSRADPVAAMTQIRDGKLPAIESVRSDVPPALAAAIGAALAVKPDDRATAIELGLALEALIKTFPEPGTTLAMAAWLRERFPRPTTGAHRAIGGARGATEGARAETAPATRAHTVPPTAQATAATGHLDALMPGGDTRIDTGAVLAGARPLTSLGRADTIATANAPHATHTEAEISAPTTARAAEISAPTAANRSADLTEADISATALMTRVAHRDLGARSRRRAPRIVIIGALAVAGGGAGAWALARATNNVQRPQVVVTAAPGAAAPAPVIAPLADAGAIAKAAASPAPDAAPAKAVAVATAVDAAPEAATLTVVTMPPGASVTVGDHAPEASPFTLTALSPGPYKVSVTLDGYRAQQASLVLGTGEKRTLQLALTAKPPPAPAPKGKVTRVADRHKSRHDRPPPAEPGLLNVRTAPYSVVYLGNRKLGVTPFAGVKLPPGHYTLVFEHPGRHRQSRRVHIRSGQTTKLSFALTDGR
ncbi:MAG TPA: PEGA domain-containing protein, partial [Kofleriaceae bacterium]|nr:PEGA domain-containing protein [Kofleriaceae bacterium]